MRMILCLALGVIFDCPVASWGYVTLTIDSFRPRGIKNTCAQRRIDYATFTPPAIADAMVAALNQPAKFKPVESDGAMRAARMLAEIL